MKNEICINGRKSDLINILESQIMYLLASGLEEDNQLLNSCYTFLQQLDENNKLLIYK